jgi:DNA modification methylase
MTEQEIENDILKARVKPFWLSVKTDEDENKQVTTSFLKLGFRNDNGYFVYKSEYLVQTKDVIRKSMVILKVNKRPDNKEKRSILIVIAILPQWTNKIHNMDCIEGMKQLDDDSIDLIVTSPPYNIGVHYNSYDDKKSDGEYEAFFVKTFLKCHRILKPGGLCCVIVGEQRRNLFLTKARNWLISIGFSYVKKINWTKTDHLQFCTPEYILIFAKDEFYYHYYSKVDAFYGNSQFADTWFIPYDKSIEKGVHPAMFPIAISQKLIEISTKKGDIVLDPFVGTGTTIVAAKQLGRQFIGFDIDMQYCEIVKKRLESTQTFTVPLRGESLLVKVKPVYEKSQLNSALKGFIAIYRLKLEKQKAKERQGRGHEPLPKKAERGKATVQAAKFVGISDRTLRKVLKIYYEIEVKKNENIKNMWDKALKDEISIESIYKEIQKSENKLKIKKNGDKKITLRQYIEALTKNQIIDNSNLTIPDLDVFRKRLFFYQTR